MLFMINWMYLTSLPNSLVNQTDNYIAVVEVGLPYILEIYYEFSKVFISNILFNTQHTLMLHFYRTGLRYSLLTLQHLTALLGCMQVSSLFAHNYSF